MKRHRQEVIHCSAQSAVSHEQRKQNETTVQHAAILLKLKYSLQ